MSITPLTVIYGALGVIFAFFWQPLLLIGSLFGLKVYKLNSHSHGNEINHLIKKISESYSICSAQTRRNDEMIPINWIISYLPFYLANLKVMSSSNWKGTSRQRFELSLFCSQTTFETLITSATTKSNNPDKDQSVKKQPILIREGAEYWNGTWYQTMIQPAKLLPDDSSCLWAQTQAFQKILNTWNQFNENGYHTLTVLISGPSGSGKSRLVDRLAQAIQGTICYGFNPTIPGTMTRQVNKARPDDRTLIFLIDEFDILVRRIHEEKVIPHKNTMTEVYDKPSHNKWLDDFYNGTSCPNSILLLTTNKPFSWFNDLDESYTRQSRIHLKLTMEGDPQEIIQVVINDRNGQNKSKNE